MLSLVLIICITIYQEYRTEKTLAALKNISSPRALVLRDGVKKRIAGREVVSGDIIFVSEGDRIPVDALVIDSSNLMIDESSLTGESIAVNKNRSEKELKIIRPNEENAIYFIYSGTMVAKGKAVAKVVRTGKNTEIGKIGTSLENIKPEKTRLQKQTSNLIQIYSIVGILLCTFVIIIYYLTRNDLITGLLAGLSLAMSILPEEFPVVLTVFLALGAWRVSKTNVLTRHVPAVETLGAITALCTDKTGTLTQNKMKVKNFWVDGKILDFDGRNDEFLNYLLLSVTADIYDPMEKAIKELGGSNYDGNKFLILEKEFPLSSTLLSTTNIWRKDKELIAVAKGSPEAIINLCHLSKEQEIYIEKGAQDLAKKGQRIIGLAAANLSGGIPNEQHEINYDFLGLIGFEDPIRPEVPQAIKECKQAGIRVIMITGDYPDTAKKIAEQAGISTEYKIITCLLYTSPSPRDRTRSRMPSSA
jgi:Ca2+-transporting ATPase